MKMVFLQAVCTAFPLADAFSEKYVLREENGSKAALIGLATILRQKKFACYAFSPLAKFVMVGHILLYGSANLVLAFVFVFVEHFIPVVLAFEILIVEVFFIILRH